ncbi:HigA family addiction module antidote protein [Pseudomonas aeruginosa]|uniref:HigA family addiction module antitoxin n=1 Tax=Pseudomonas aeruginosa TaxID=287 RepID=UPI00053DA2CF|nr:HigA family addiction module antitoxin [Pseudomonas aeruginosa]WCV81053.1 HigA family addiction module antidote protein [Pseudomonas aeruginosa]HBO0859777.1 HigA family addiction module antidote protein [Pseudomonas aeruginosa]HCE6879329.1 HigA family addiction module antidote protein [Pseudomonas aeruginosa]HDR2971916.1 HigA family addiction module antidote protein [Pseudomonas aeruginosa]
MPMYDPPHPGEALREDILPALGMNVQELAAHIGYSPDDLSSVVNGQAPITADLAHRLELSGIATARLHLAEQAAYDLWQAEHRRKYPPIARLEFA